jgi:hypothetical protein
VVPGEVSEAAGSRLLERERELDELGRLLELARVGSGRVLLVSGPAGIGKTRVLAATSGLARGAGFCVCEAAAGELERDLAWVLSGRCLLGWWVQRPGATRICLPALPSWRCLCSGSGTRQRGWMR